MRIKKHTLEKLAEIEINLARLDVAVITRYPDSSRAAEAYEALRKGIINVASATRLHQQNLLSLANAIDEGATTETLRSQLCDLLSTLKVREIRFEEAQMELGQDLNQVFTEVGETAHERSAWVRVADEQTDILQKGYIREFPQDTLSTESKVDQDSNQEYDASIDKTDADIQEHELDPEAASTLETRKSPQEENES